MTQALAFLSIHLTKISLIYKGNKTSYEKFMVRHKHTTRNLLRQCITQINPTQKHNKVTTYSNNYYTCSQVKQVHTPHS